MCEHVFLETLSTVTGNQTIIFLSLKTVIHCSNWHCFHYKGSCILKIFLFDHLYFFLVKYLVKLSFAYFVFIFHFPMVLYKFFVC